MGIKYKNIYTDKVLLDKIKDFYNKYGKVPTSNNIDISSGVYARRFGSWNKAVELSGLTDKISIERSKKFYNKNNMCDKCGINFDITNGHPYRELDNDENWTGKWLCSNCRTKYYNKSKRHIRLGILDSDSNIAKGYKFEELTCRWRGVKNLNKLNNNLNTPLDHTKDLELGIIQTKGRYFDIEYRTWTQNVLNEHKKIFDNLIFYCANDHGSCIERVYIFPYKEIMRRSSITIYNTDNKKSWSEYFNINDKNILIHINKIWEKILNENKED